MISFRKANQSTMTRLQPRAKLESSESYCKCAGTKTSGSMKRFAATALRSPSPEQPWEEEFQHFVTKRRCTGSTSTENGDDYSSDDSAVISPAVYVDDEDALLAECDEDDAVFVRTSDDRLNADVHTRSVSYSNFNDSVSRSRRAEFVACRLLSLSTPTLFTKPRATDILLGKLRRSSSESVAMTSQLEGRQAEIVRQIVTGWN